MDSCVDSPGHRGGDAIDILAPHLARLAGVWIQAADGDPGRTDAKLVLEVASSDSERVIERSVRQCSGYVSERKVRGHQADPQNIAGEHHHRVRPAHLAQNLGMPGHGQPRVGHQRFVKRGGADGRETARNRVLNGAAEASVLQVAEGGEAASKRNLLQLLDLPARRSRELAGDIYDGAGQVDAKVGSGELQDVSGAIQEVV